MQISDYIFNINGVNHIFLKKEVNFNSSFTPLDGIKYKKELFQPYTFYFEDKFLLDSELLHNFLKSKVDFRDSKITDLFS